MKTTAIILAGGKGKRIGSDKNKVFLIIKEPILVHTLKEFEKHELINDIILVIHNDDIEEAKNLIQKYRFTKIIKIIEGGKERQDSSYNGIKIADCDIALIHDAARPFLNEKIITASINDAIEFGASVTGVPTKDTIKEIENGFASKTLDRRKLWNIQTPQTFKLEIIKKAHEKCKEEEIKVTDDSALVEHLGHKVKLTLGSYENIKITTPKDIEYAKQVLK